MSKVFFNNQCKCPKPVNKCRYTLFYLVLLTFAASKILLFSEETGKSTFNRSFWLLNFPPKNKEVLNRNCGSKYERTKFTLHFHQNNFADHSSSSLFIQFAVKIRIKDYFLVVTSYYFCGQYYWFECSYCYRCYSIGIEEIPTFFDQNAGMGPSVYIFKSKVHNKLLEHYLQ